MSVEFIFKETGVFRREISERQVKFDQAILSHVGAAVTRKISNAFPGTLLKQKITRPINLSAGAADSFFSVELDALVIESCYAPYNDGKIIYPAFCKRGIPMLKLEWVTPLNMRLMFFVHLDSMNRFVNNYLVAYDNEGRQYMLPLSNIYDDCKLCTGRFEPGYRASAFEVVVSCVEQFYSSSWQGDLYKKEREDMTLGMFGFKVEGDKFTQGLNPEINQDWTRFAVRMSNNTVNTRAILNPIKKNE